jgi:small subunit ribosomal protein S6
MEGVVTSTGGTMRKLDKMGRRRLAYRLYKYHEGQYVLFDMECEAPTVQELERRLKVADPVMRFITVRTDEDAKRRAKMQQIRSKKSARKKPKSGTEAAASA